MLPGHDDECLKDKNMKATLALNHFGPICKQRMPTVTWQAISRKDGESMQLSEANNFTESGNKEEIFLPSVFQDLGEATQMKGFDEKSMPWNFYCVEDLFEIGVSFNQTGIGKAKPSSNIQRWLKVANAKYGRSITSSSGALRCSNSRC
ncbi:hypothetical protein NC651_010564 [Populus alba x Populus x berolinensis]|nr:hypothetical protein NC651_010564 [Populus alba x Populus x berolinensis]